MVASGWPAARRSCGSISWSIAVSGDMSTLMKQLAANSIRPHRHQQARIDALHQERHERQQEELRDAAPHHHLADLLGVVALDLREIGRDQVDRAERRGAEHRHQDARAADRGIGEQAQIDERLVGGELGDQRSATMPMAPRRWRQHDQARIEPFLALALLQHEGQRQLRPIAIGAMPSQSPLAQLAELHRPLCRARSSWMRDRGRPGTTLR